MFTGLVEAVGEVLERAPMSAGERLTFSHRFTELELGESISVEGACLTVVSFDDARFSVDVSLETLRVTTLRHLVPGSQVNFERALRAGDRLGGHLVTGHVDGLAVVCGHKQEGDMTLLSLRLPEELAPYVARKGSLTVNGVSLTVNKVSGECADLTLIPHTLEVTTLKHLRLSREVNIEVDLIARYVERLLEARAKDPEDPKRA